MKKKPVTYATRYKHKLNLLGPGQWMLGIAAALGGVGLVLHLLHFATASVVFFAAGGVLAGVLLVLVAVESHQDRVLYELAKREDSQIP